MKISNQWKQLTANKQHCICTRNREGSGGRSGYEVIKCIVIVVTILCAIRYISLQRGYYVSLHLTGQHSAVMQILTQGHREFPFGNPPPQKFPAGIPGNYWVLGESFWEFIKYKISNFYRAMHVVLARYWYHMSSVCPYVRLSVRDVDIPWAYRLD